MKNYLFIIVFLIAIDLNAATVSLTEPCSEDVAVIYDYEITQDETIGSVTIKTLDTLGIPYIGAERGIHSIFNTPTDTDAYDIISKTEMKAYGWCYTINGFEPSLLANEVEVTQNDQVMWWFGFAHYKEGEWIAQCKPSSLTPEFCKRND